MANGRIAFDDILRGIIGNGNVYFQPPESVKLKYDCIIYEVTDADTKYADNLPYHYTKAYEVTVIYRNFQILRKVMVINLTLVRI